MDKHIPFLDLVTPHMKLESELMNVVQRTLRSAGFIGGEMVDTFEKEFALFCGARHCIGVSSGTDALLFALVASGVRPGDVVVTVPNTFIATVEAILQSGAFPDFVDVDDKTCLMDMQKLEEYLATQCEHDGQSGPLIHKKTRRPVRAVIPVHLYGLMADMDSVLDLASKYGLTVIEDACQAHGARYYSKRTGQWEMAGSMGHAAAFSFYPGKNLGACGDAGAVTTNSEALASKVRMLRDHGQSEKYVHAIEGYTGRLDAIQAGFLTVKLRHLDQWIAGRRRVAFWYKEVLKNLSPLACQCEPMDSISAYHLFVIRTPYRDRMKAFLNSNGIATGLHYPIPVHKQSCMSSHKFSSTAYPVAEKHADEILSLPMFPELRRDQVHTISGCIHEFYRTLDLAASPDVDTLTV